MKAKRGRNFATIIYPDDERLGEDFDLEKVIREWHVSAFLSPLHDSDTDDDGCLKKPHYHLLVKFDGNKSVDQVREMFDQVCGVGCEFVDSLRGYARYLCHLDETDDHKPQYPVDQVITFGDFDYFDLINSQVDNRQLLKDIKVWIKDHHVTLFCELVDYACDNEPEWFNLLINGYTLFITQYMKSLEYGDSHKSLYKLKVNKDD